MKPLSLINFVVRKLTGTRKKRSRDSNSSHYSHRTDHSNRSSLDITTPRAHREALNRNANLALSRGDAEAYVVNGDKALAMAKSSTGAACAYTDGITPGIHEEGSGRAGVRGGTAWAKAGRENMAIAHSKAAQHRSERRRNTLPRPRPSPLSSEKMTSGEMIQKVKADRARRRVRYQPEPEPEWTLYGRETGLVVSGGGGAAFVERGQYVLTNGKQAAFLDRTEAGYIDDSGTGYMDSENFRYISHSGIGYIKSKKFRYISG